MSNEKQPPTVAEIRHTFIEACRQARSRHVLVRADQLLAVLEGHDAPETGGAAAATDVELET